MNLLLGGIIALVLMFGLVVFRGAPYVPSRRRDVRRAFKELYPLGPSDLLVDIGAGDGVVLRQAAACGARAVGYELNPVLVGVSLLLSRSYRHLITVRLADFWRVKLPGDTTIVYTFGESRDITKMYTKVVQEATRLDRTLYFMSFGFHVPDVAPYKKDKTFFLYRVDPLQGK